MTAAVFVVFVAVAADIERAARIPERTFREQIAAAQSLDERVRIYATLIESTGVERAQRVLVNLEDSSLSSNDFHLLNHLSGEVLYEQYGKEALPLCTDAFSFSCFHGFLIAAVATEGDAAFETLMHLCGKEQARSGQNGCAHGLGHGLLAWLEYRDLPRALSVCTEGARAAGVPRPLAEQCWSGVFMENITGTHLGVPSPDRWYKTTDPVYPCNAPPVMDQDAASLCWSVQSQFLTDSGLWFDNDIPSATAFCRTLEGTWQSQCLEGVARHIQLYVSEAPEDAAVGAQCEFMGASLRDQCLVIAARSAYFSDKKPLSYVLCARIDSESDRAMCVRHVAWEIALAEPRPLKRRTACSHFPRAEEQMCREAVRTQLSPPVSPFSPQ